MSEEIHRARFVPREPRRPASEKRVPRASSRKAEVRRVEGAVRQPRLSCADDGTDILEGGDHPMNLRGPIVVAVALLATACRGRACGRAPSPAAAALADAGLEVLTAEQANDRVRARALRLY
jgi:hypothetical protein